MAVAAAPAASSSSLVSDNCSSHSIHDKLDPLKLDSLLTVFTVAADAHAIATYAAVSVLAPAHVLHAPWGSVRATTNVAEVSVVADAVVADELEVDVGHGGARATWPRVSAGMGADMGAGVVEGAASVDDEMDLANERHASTGGSTIVGASGTMGVCARIGGGEAGAAMGWFCHGLVLYRTPHGKITLQGVPELSLQDRFQNLPPRV